MPQVPHTHPRRARGVWYEDYLSPRHRPLIEVIQSDGTRLHERELLPGEDPAALEECLWQMLDREDPLPLQARSA